jgi:protein tyrosine/serine phosphatase
LVDSGAGEAAVIGGSVVLRGAGVKLAARGAACFPSSLTHPTYRLAKGLLVKTFDLTSAGGRFIAYLDYLWTDHAYLRLGFQNAHWISGEMVRSNQPWPFQLARWKREGIKTIVNLRGGFDASFHILERDACERLGLTLANFTMTSRDVPSKAQVLAARELFETIAYPAVMHCKSGSDRAGIMGVLYAHFRLGQPIRQAMGQLSPRYLHVRQGLTGVLDYIFELYLAEGGAKGLSFVDWVQSPGYDPVKIKADFRANRATGLGILFSDKLLRRE